MPSIQLINREQLEELIHMQETLNCKYGSTKWRDNFSFGQAKIAVIDEVGEFIREIESDWKWWKVNPNYHKQKALFELIDIVHFALMMALYHTDNSTLAMTSTDLTNDDFVFTPSDDKYDDFSLAISDLLQMSKPEGDFGRLNAKRDSLRVILDVINSGGALLGGLDSNAIYQSYIMKNHRNHTRVDEGVLVGRYDKNNERDLIYAPKVR